MADENFGLGLRRRVRRVARTRGGRRAVELAQRGRRWARRRRRRLPAAAELPALTGTEPVSRSFGWDRGSAIDRHYIDAFIARHSADLRGRALEIGDATYLRRFGTALDRIDVLSPVAGSDPDITIVGDLETGEGVPEQAFDAIVLTQTLQYIFDLRAAIEVVHRALRPGGVVLATLPALSQVSRPDMETWGDLWRFTDASAERLFTTAFDADRVEVGLHGNVYVAAASLYGLAREELPTGALVPLDPDYPVVVTIRARKAVPDPAPGEAG